ncbi:MAG: helix-turn-helix domain-containing protein [Planctomycetota bacterium]
MNLLTVADLAARLQLHPVNVRTMLRRGELGRALRIGRCWRLAESELERALEGFAVPSLPSRAARSNPLVPKPEFLALLRPRPKEGGNK